MVDDRQGRSGRWGPSGFERYRVHYPATDWRAPRPAHRRSAAFAAAWSERASAPISLAAVLTPGLFAEWMPGCFREAARHFAARGHRCLVTPVSTRLDARTQSRRLGARLRSWLRPNERFVWCAHSKGGIDALTALGLDPTLRERCAALVLVQLPVGFSWVVEDLRAPHRAGRRAPIADRLLGRASRGRLFAAGLDEISRARPPDLERWLGPARPHVPTLHAVSWSLTPTHRMDTWHERLERLRPGHAHDGQFFLADQALEGVPTVGLPALDHAQPVLGGGGLDSGRLWAALAAVACRERVPPRRASGEIELESRHGVTERFGT